MLYGDSKTRTIARSVLPSTRPKTARDALAGIKRRNRRVTRVFLGQVADDPEWFYEDEAFDPTYYPNLEIQEAVWERRTHDNLGPILRWAPRATDHLDNADSRYYYMKDLLPKDLSGRHAMTHITNLEEFDMRYEHDRSYRYSEYAAQNTKTARKARYEAIRQERIDLLKQAVRDVRHGEINSVIKKSHVPSHYIHASSRWARIQTPERWEHCEDCHNPRTFGGWHDIEAFVDHVHASRHGEVSDALKSIGLWT